VSARSRAFPWWGECHLPGAPTFAELEAAAQAEAEARPDRIDVHFTGVSSWHRESWKSQGRDLLGYPVFYVERESWPADVVEMDRVLREAGIITVGE
jgi:hypothetical protein